MREHVVRDDETAGLDHRPRKGEESLVVPLLSVEEDDIEDVFQGRKRLEGVALHELGPLVETGLPKVPPPGLALRRVALERGDVTSKNPGTRREPGPPPTESRA